MNMKKFLLMVLPLLPSRVNIISHEMADDTSKSLKIRLVTHSHGENYSGSLITCRPMLVALSLLVLGVKDTVPLGAFCASVSG